MTDRPILFSTPMVRALLDGRKSQTRRLLTVPGVMGGRYPILPPEEAIELEDGEFARGVWHYRSDCGPLSGPYDLSYAVGQRLWVKEAWRTLRDFDSYKPSGLPVGAPIFPELDRDNCDRHGRYRSFRFMPRWASRLTLTVTEVRVQRVRAISERDARAEGLEFACDVGPQWRGSMNLPWRTVSPCHAFRDLWNTLHAKPGERWEDDPFVTAITFTVEQRNIDA